MSNVKTGKFGKIDKNPITCNRVAPLVFAGLALILGSQSVYADDTEDEHESRGHRSLSMDFSTTTQGTFWPPATFVDEDGNYILIGSTLEHREGTDSVQLYPLQAVIVSKDTVPPLDADGLEDFSNPFAAPYKIIRQLDMNPGSPDLDLIMHSQSFGPYQGNFGGGGRSPKLGDSPYNLNGIGGAGWEEPCTELFPAESQRFSFTRESLPIHEGIIPGFKGDQVSYNIDTGDQYVPVNRNGAECPPEGCTGEDKTDTRRTKPITLNEFLKQKVKLKVKLTDYSEEKGAYTAARFTLTAENLFPNSIFQVVVGRTSFLQGMPLSKLAHAVSMPNIVISDSQGRGKIDFVMENPFPDPAIDDAGLRVAAIGLVLKSDFLVAGMCNFRYAPGVDVHAIASSLGDGNLDDFDSLLTVAPIK